MEFTNLEIRQKCIEIACIAHDGQYDKKGVPYINHVAAVAATMIGFDCKCIAWLHDVVEDTDVTLERLFLEFIPVNIVESVDAITRRKSETYKEYIKRCCLNKDARLVKQRDLMHNLSRLSGLDVKTKERLEKKYTWAFNYILEKKWL